MTIEAFNNSLTAIGVAPVTNETYTLFEQYAETLFETNKKFNLTAVPDIDSIFFRHFTDSLALCKFGILNYNDIIDVGSGAGFPGIPIKLYAPEKRLTLLDATEKKVNFIRMLAKDLEIDINCIHGRCEEIANAPEYRAKFGVVTTRAVAKLNTLCEMCLPLLKIGGFFYAMKSKDYKIELEDSKNAIDLLGGQLVCEELYTVPEQAVRSVVIIKKISETTSKYPRKYSKIISLPL